MGGSDRAIRPKGQASTCITVAASATPRGTPDGMVGEMLRLLACPAGAPSARQQWMPTSTSYAMHAGICARLARPPFGVPERRNSRSGYCLNYGVDEMGRGV